MRKKKGLFYGVIVLILIIIFILVNNLRNSFYEKLSKSNENFILQNILNDEEKIITDFKMSPDDIWRITIKVLDIEGNIREGTSSEILEYSIGHFEESSIWDGNVCLAAHNRGFSNSTFRYIKDLKEGDEIFYETPLGIRKYRVCENGWIYETDWSKLEESNENKLTLITCMEDVPDKRICVVAKQEKVI